MSMSPPTSSSELGSSMKQRSFKDSAESEPISSLTGHDSVAAQDGNDNEDTSMTPTMYTGDNEARQYPDIILPTAAQSIHEIEESLEPHRLSLSSLNSLGSAKQGNSIGKSTASSTTGSELECKLRNLLTYVNLC